MDPLKKSRWRYYNALLLVSLMLPMSIAAVLDFAPDYSGSIAGAVAPGAKRDKPLSGGINEKVYFITNVIGNETIKELEANLLLERLSLTIRGQGLRFFKMLLPFGGFGVLILCIGYIIHKKKQNKSILSFMLGGHAPPCDTQLFCIS